MEEKITLGKFITRKRREKGLTQKELARRLYVTESAVSKWERGLSYPDISLVTGLCGELGITEHELVTASEDYRQRQVEKQARAYRRFTQGYVWATSSLYILSLLICLIVNLALDHTLSWFFIVLFAEMTGYSLTTLSVLLPKWRLLGMLSGFFLSLNLLLAVCCLYAGGDWFPVSFAALLFSFCVVFAPLVLRTLPIPVPFARHKSLLCLAADTLLLFVLLAVVLSHKGAMGYFFSQACPVALYAILLPWALLMAIRYLRIHALFRTAVCLAVSSVYVFLLNSVLRVLLENGEFTLPALHWGQWTEPWLSGNVIWLCTFLLLGMAVLFAAGGIALTVRGQRSTPAEAERR